MSRKSSKNSFKFFQTLNQVQGDISDVLLIGELMWSAEVVAISQSATKQTQRTTEGLHSL